MSPIAQALAAGYGEEEILKFMSRALPNIAPSIKKARNSGYSIPNILGFLSKIMQEDEFDPYLSQSAAHKKVREKRERTVKELANTALTATAAYGAAKAIPGAIRGIKGIFGNTPNIGPSPMSNAPVNPPPIPGAASTLPPAPMQPTIATPAPAPAPAGLTPQNSIKTIEEMQLGPRIQTLRAAGNNEEQIAAAINATLKGDQRKWFGEKLKKGEVKPLQEMVKDYVDQFGIQPQTEKITPETQPKKSIRTEYPGGYYEGANWQGSGAAQRHPEIKEGNKLEKGSLVATPSGNFGNIESVRDKEALVKDDDGKLHKVSKEDLIESPLLEKDLAELHEDLIRGIEKETGEEVSRNVNWAGYDPTNNSLAYLPHSGALYIYNDISPEDASNLTNILTKRKSSGENFIGAWKEGTKSPIGASMYQLIRRLQEERGGKGSEYAQKFPTVYSALEPAIKAAKLKKKRKK